MKSIGTPFLNGLEVFGWTALTNPLIAFFKAHLNSLELTKSSYITLHNLLARNIIDKATLQDLSKVTDITKASHVLLNPEAYKLNGTDLTRLVQAQKVLWGAKGNLPLTYQNNIGNV